MLLTEKKKRLGKYLRRLPFEILYCRTKKENQCFRTKSAFFQNLAGHKANLKLAPIYNRGMLSESKISVEIIMPGRFMKIKPKHSWFRVRGFAMAPRESGRYPAP